MESPINKKIQRSLERSAAKKKEDSNYVPVLTLRQRVLSLVTEANANALQERHITPRSALTVMDRSIERLSALEGDAKEFAVLREVASYISTAQKTFVASASTHTDLLPQGHPLSSLNASLTPEEYRFKYAQWLAADPDVSHNARPLVAAAFSAQPGSLEREHAFMRLSVTSEKVPGYFKLDPTPIVAAFSDGNSSAARRARVALQWRDKKGRWVEMGRGANFRYRTSSGSVAAASGVYVGARPSRPGENKSPAGLIQVSGDKNLPDGIYAVQPQNVETYSARIPTEALKKAGVTPGLRPDQSALGIPTQEEVIASRQDAPTGWTKQSDGTFTSDDNYTVKTGEGEYSLYRQNADGSLGEKVGEGASWADINDLANNDEESYDAVKGQDNSADREQVKARIKGRTKYNEEFDRLEELAKSGVDQNGNKVPVGWEADVKRGAMPEVERRAIGRDRVFGEEGLPYLEYSKTYADDNGNPVTAKAMFMRDGKFYANDKEYDSWDAAEADIPNWIKAEEDKRGRDLTPVTSEEIKLPAFEGRPSDIVNPFELEPTRDDRAGYFDKDGNRLTAPDNVIKPPQDLKVGDEVYIPSAGWRKVKRISKDEKRLEGRKKTLPLYRVEYEDEEGKTGTWKWTPFSEDGQGNKIKGLETRTPVDEKLASLTEEQNKKVDAEIRDLIKNPPAPTEMDKRVEKLLKEQRAEWDKAKEDNYARVLDRDGRIGGQDDFLGPEKTRKLNEEFRKSLKDSKKPSGDTNEPSGPTGKEIYERRIATGDSLDKVAKDLGIPREEVRRLEAEYGRTLDSGSGTVDADKARNIEDIDKALEFLDAHMDDEGLSESTAMGISAVQDYVKDAKKYLENGNVKEAIFSLGTAFDIMDGSDYPSEGRFPIGKNSAEAQDIVDKLITRLEGGDGPDEPPTPPSGGTPPKPTSPSTPSAPGLFSEFKAPDGAFELRTADYDPEGRVDERSTDFTDDPERLATKFTVQDLIAAFSEAIIGNSSDAAVAEILNVNVGDDDELDAPSEVDLDADIPQVSLGTPSGAGRLEFNAGEEFVPAEALFNALWHAGVDPNRVLANVYDSVTGDNKNLSKLIDAQGGTPSPEEAQLVDDITAEIRQIKDATPDDEPSIVNQKDAPSKELKGSLIENIAIDFENPDYYIPDPDAYVPSQEEPDENGYTDNPKILATDYEDADLIMQMLEGITDGSGAALLNFGDITTEVPVEAMRDALQYNGINTNDILVDLKRESNDMSEELQPGQPGYVTRERTQAHTQMIKDLVEQSGNTLDDDTADKIRDAIDEQGLVDWSEADDAEIIEAIAEVAGRAIFGRVVRPQDVPVSPPQSGDRQPYTEEEPVSTTGEQGQAPSVEAPIDSPEYETPQFVYPGPREAGYTVNNTVLDSNGVAVGAGVRVKALGDGRTGTILAVQNIDTRSGRDADYVRVRFDDGKVAVRSARQIFGIEGGSPVSEEQGPGQLPRARRNPIAQDPAQRFNEPPAVGTPVIAGDGSIPGVQLVDTPDDIAELANPDAKQSDYVAWGLRAPEIARAGRDRVAIDKIVELGDKADAARLVVEDSTASPEEQEKARNERADYKAQIEKLVRDAFGIRPGVKFGRNNYTIGEGARVSYNRYRTGEIEVSIGFRILNESGIDIGEGSRTLTAKPVENPDGTSTVKWEAKNNILKLTNTKDKKSGFAEAYNRYMEDWYIANGFDSVKVYAAGDGRHWQGGLVWALNGFNWDDNQARLVPAILRRMASRASITDEEMQIIKRMQDRIAKDNPTGDYTPDTVPTPLELALIGWYPDATNWIGKKYMVATSWYGQKRLNPEAIEQRQAINYNQSREARKRIEAKLNKAGISRELVLKMNSNEFADANPELSPYLDQIRDVLRNNRSLAVLSPAAKTALNRYTAGQLLKGEGRDATLQDIIKLRVALDAEFKADNPLASSKEFGVGNQLLDVSIYDVSNNRIPGFTVKRLGMYESGINDTYVVTHNDSGQVFFLKKDSYAAQYQIDGAGAEVQADAMLRATGVAGYETRVSNIDPEIIVMQRAGAGIPLLGEPMTAINAIGNKLSINLPDGTTVKVDAMNFMDLLHTPEDAVRVMLVDLIISNMDRHNGNMLLAVDGTDTGKIRILPIDHALSSFSPDTEGMQFTVQELFDNRGDNLYGMAMPVLTERLKQEEILDLFRNEARIMMEQLNNPANLPTGKELDLIVKNFGSLDAYRAKIQERIDSLLTPGNEGYKTFLSVLKPSYWSR